MINFKRIYAIFVARNLEFLRDRSAFIWQLMFPIVIVIIFGFAFGRNNETSYKVGVINFEQAKQRESSLLQNEFIRFTDIDDIDEGIRKVSEHSLDMLFDPISFRYWTNEESSNASLVEALLFDLSDDKENSVRSNFMKQTISGKAIRYIDWLIPGILAMNMMFSALFGVGYVIVRYRKNEVLKRLKATPTKPIEFLIAQICSRIFIIVFNILIIFIGLNIIFRFRMNGSYFDLFVVMVLGGLCLLSLGLIVAARFRTEEVANGVLNLITWPLMMLSEIWFSLDNANVVLQKISAILPVTQITKLSRAIMLDGKSLTEMPFEMLYLLVFTTVCLLIGSLFFKWE